LSSIGAASENQEVIKALKDLESDMQVLVSQLAVDPSLKKYIQENNSMARDLVLEQYEKRIASSGTEASSILLNSSETESCPKIGDSQAFPPLKKAILQGKGPVAEVREDYSLKAREDSVTVNFNSVTNPAMEVVTTAMKKEFSQQSHNSAITGWRSLFDESSNNQLLEYYKPTEIGGQKAPKEVIQEGIQHWDSCLVGQIFLKNPKYSLVYNVANMLWGRDGSVEVMAADKSFWVEKKEKFRLVHPRHLWYHYEANLAKSFKLGFSLNEVSQLGISTPLHGIAKAKD